ncbi:uncharacterized protein [Palaemon carinicauda]|uniref:uncharacterized protein isoform X3 n=1 Tax=Palaemon carinicauda TaxID=392227 RepID=UPI0035B66C45
MNSAGDDLLFEKKGNNPKVFWRPKHGRPIANGCSSYRPFQQIVRTVHVKEALQVCLDQRLQPKPIASKSILNSLHLRNSRHPCKNIKVLWFGTQPPILQNKKMVHDWYGNVQFAIPVDILNRWKYFYLVEMESTPKHTVSRLLISNNDYSSVLPFYDPWQEGGPWVVNSSGHFVPTDCSRYNGEGRNKNGHILEFMIEAEISDQTAILNACSISFQNHSKVESTGGLPMCHRSRFTNTKCPSPLKSLETALLFFDQHQRMARMTSVATPRLSKNGEIYRGFYLLKLTFSIPYWSFPPMPQSQILNSCLPYNFLPGCSPTLLTRRGVPQGVKQTDLSGGFPSKPYSEAFSSYRVFTQQTDQTAFSKKSSFFYQSNGSKTFYHHESHSWGMQRTNHGDDPCQMVLASWGETEERQRLWQSSGELLNIHRTKASWGEKEEYERLRNEQLPGYQMRFQTQNIECC